MMTTGLSNAESLFAPQKQKTLLTFRVQREVYALTVVEVIQCIDLQYMLWKVHTHLNLRLKFYKPKYLFIFAFKLFNLCHTCCTMIFENLAETIINTANSSRLYSCMCNKLECSATQINTLNLNRENVHVSFINAEDWTDVGFEFPEAVQIQLEYLKVALNAGKSIIVFFSLIYLLP